MKKLLKTIFAVGAALSLAASASAVAIAIGDSNDLGTINPNEPNGTEAETAHVNYLIEMALGGSASNVQLASDPGSQNNDYSRTMNNPLATYTAAVFALKQDTSSTTINLGTGGYTYLLAKYDHSGAGAEVWYIGGLTGTISVPGSFNGYGLSHISLFTTDGSAPDEKPVPDGGTTVALLGLAFAGLSATRRFIKR